MRVLITNAMVSNLKIHDFVNNVIANELIDDRHDYHDPAERLTGHGRQIVWYRDHHHRDRDQRHNSEHHTGNAAVSTGCSNLPSQPKSLANYIRELLQNLTQVSTSFALHGHSRR